MPDEPNTPDTAPDTVPSPPTPAPGYEPELGDTVREKKYSQPLRVTETYPAQREVQVQPEMQPDAPKRWVPFEEVEPYHPEG